MPSIIKTAQARSDLLEIWLYIAEQNEEAATNLLLKIDRDCEKLAGFPRLGRDRGLLKPNLRSWTTGNYLIFYTPIENGIEIIRVLHGARDVDALFEAKEFE